MTLTNFSTSFIFSWTTACWTKTSTCWTLVSTCLYGTILSTWALIFTISSASLGNSWILSTIWAKALFKVTIFGTILSTVTNYCVLMGTWTILSISWTLGISTICLTILSIIYGTSITYFMTLSTGTIFSLKRSTETTFSL